jgi:cytochrome c-type biogenesis protein CcmH
VTRLLVPILAALAAGVLLAALPARAADPPNAADLEAELVCPVCQTTLDQSNAPVAERMKAFIRERIAAGDTEQEIKDALVAEFGPAVLATPGKRGFGLLAWLIPLLALAGGVVAVALLVRRWTERRATDVEPAAGGAELDAALEQRLDEELARFDG